MATITTTVSSDYYSVRTWATYHSLISNTAIIQWSTTDQSCATEYGEIPVGENLDLEGFQGRIYFKAASGSQTLTKPLENGEDPRNAPVLPPLPTTPAPPISQVAPNAGTPAPEEVTGKITVKTSEVS